jgi:hypothetical protein
MDGLLNSCQENDMSVILESLLDDERRSECGANDGAIAMGWPIVAYQPTGRYISVGAIQPAACGRREVAPPDQALRMQLHVNPAALQHQEKA